MNKAVFLDRDGVINKDRPNYVYKATDLEILDGVVESLMKFKEAGFKILVITNQSGIAKGIYKHEDVKIIHELVQEQCNHCIDAFYYAPWHPSVSESLTRKPGRLLFERAIAKFNIDPTKSWMVGDKDRDLVPAKSLGINTIQVEYSDSATADHQVYNLWETLPIILRV